MFVGTRGTEKPQCQRSSMLTKRTHAGEPKSFPSQNIQKPEVNGEKRDIRFFKLLHINRAGLSVTNKTNKQQKKDVCMVCINFCACLLYRKYFSITFRKPELYYLNL